MIANALPFVAGAESIFIASGSMFKSVEALYGITKSIHEYIDEHIREMKESANYTIARTGRVMEMAKFGFGIGYVTPVVVIGVGQLILGNPLAAIAVAATAATLTNPIAMTCAAVGAIYYGWNALSDQEKDEMLERLSEGFNIGKVLINSMIAFVLDTLKKLFDESKKLLNVMRDYVGSAAEIFGKKLYDVTGNVMDKLVRVPKIFIITKENPIENPSTKKPLLDLDGDGDANFDDFVYFITVGWVKKNKPQN